MAPTDQQIPKTIGTDHAQHAEPGSLFSLGNAWFEAIGAINAEIAGFVADRIKEDRKTQQDMLACRNLTDLQHVQAQFVQTAINQYLKETGRLVELGTKGFAPKGVSALSAETSQVLLIRIKHRCGQTP